MSFLRHLLPAFDQPAHAQETLDRHSPNKQNAPHVERGPPVTLTRIRQALYDPEDYPFDADAHNPDAEGPKTPQLDISAHACTVDDVLRKTRAFLDTKIRAEQACYDTETEFPFEKVVPHPKGKELPEFSSPRELATLGRGSDLTIPVRNLGMSSHGDILRRIDAGEGPRPFKPEDLVGKLRLKPRPSSGLDRHTHTQESYDELLDVLHAWNVRVGSTLAPPSEPKELLDALESRCQLIDEVEKGLQDQSVLEQQCLHLREVLHAYRPELGGFKDQDTMNQLIVMVANQGIAIPDLDDNVRERTIEMLFREFRSQVYLGADHSSKRNRLRNWIERARLQEDNAHLLELIKDRKQLDKESCNEASERVRTTIKIARRRLWERILGDIQLLTEQQTGQKWMACDVAATAASASVQRCTKSENALDAALQAWGMDVDEPLRDTIDRLRNMNTLGRDNSRLTTKLVGFDVPSAERKATMERRRKDPRTPYVMMEVSNQNLELRRMSQRVLERMDALDDSVHCTLDAAKARFAAHDTLLTRVDEGDAGCTGEATLGERRIEREQRDE